MLCYNDNCSYVVCNTNSDCGINRFVDIQFCQANNIYQNYITFTCNNPGTASAYCVSSTVPSFQKQCGQGEVCYYGSCVDSRSLSDAPSYNTNSNNYYPQNSYNQTSYYVKHYRTGCYKNGIYWYDSYGSIQDIYKNCASDNSCNVDSCSDNICVNRLKCDGSTCQKGSADYIKYCGGKDATLSPAPSNITPVKTPAPSAEIKQDNSIISILGKKSGDKDWMKNFSARAGDKLDFMITINNVSGNPISNVSVKADIEGDVDYTGELKIDEMPSSGISCLK